MNIFLTVKNDLLSCNGAYLSCIGEKLRPCLGFHGFKSHTGSNLLSPYFHHCIISVFITVKDCFQIQFLMCTSPIWFYMYSKSSMGKIFALVYTTLLIIKLDFTHGYVLFLKIILSVFFLNWKDLWVNDPSLQHFANLFQEWVRSIFP